MVHKRKKQKSRPKRLMNPLVLLRAQTFTNRRKEASKRACRGQQKEEA